MVDFEPKTGQLCAGYSREDGYWYRVLILDGKIGDKVSMVFITLHNGVCNL